MFNRHFSEIINAIKAFTYRRHSASRDQVNDWLFRYKHDTHIQDCFYGL